MKSEFTFGFWGGEPLAVPVLEELKRANLTPEFVVCNPDRPVGRKQVLTPPPAKVWAQENNIPVHQPTSYKDESTKELFINTNCDVFVVVAYNFILPQWLLDIPKHGVINVHPSLLPRLRGASPIRTAILNNLPEEVGVTIMLLDEKMDHGPILQQEPLLVTPEEWPIAGPTLDQKLATLGGELLAETLPAWISGDLSPQEQDHDQATYCGRLEKGDSEIKLNPQKLPTGIEAKKIWHAIQAFAGIGGVYFIHNQKRVKVAEASFEDDKLTLQRVIPEGKKEMDFAQYTQSL